VKVGDLVKYCGKGTSSFLVGSYAPHVGIVLELHEPDVPPIGWCVSVLWSGASKSGMYHLNEIELIGEK